MNDSCTRQVKLTVRLSPDEHRALQDLSHTARIPLAEFLRRAGLSHKAKSGVPTVPEVNREAYARLGSLAAKFEEVLPLLTAEHIPLVGDDLRALLNAAIERTQSLRTALIGQEPPCDC